MLILTIFGPKYQAGFSWCESFEILSGGNAEFHVPKGLSKIARQFTAGMCVLPLSLQS